MEPLIPHHSVENYLPITLKEFENINQKNKICYRLVHGEQHYTMAEIKRFIRECLGTTNATKNTKTTNTSTNFY
jgi:uncharacterized protein (DUF2141 family)